VLRFHPARGVRDAPGIWNLPSCRAVSWLGGMSRKVRKVASRGQTNQSLEGQCNSTSRSVSSVGVASQMLHEQDAIVEDTSTDVPIGQFR